MHSQKGKLFLIPAPLNENEECLSEMQKKSICELQNFIVENAKPARQALKKMGLKSSLQELNIIENNKNCEFDYQYFIEKIHKGEDFGLLSDCGLPCIADPGSNIVAYCHQNNIEVTSIANTSSITTSLMCSGMNGQHFEFIGYLQIDKNKRKDQLQNFYKQVLDTKKTYILIETPHRNQATFEDIVDLLQMKLNYV
jgi:16S rRNA (cytidine1402-2'-O)-methyltransferase